MAKVLILSNKYTLSNYAIFFSGLVATLVSYLFIWKNNSVNYVGGDAEYYYYYLRSTFIDSKFINYGWLTDSNGMHHHPVGLSILLLPFFLLAFFYASICDYPLDGVSQPFQLMILIAALTYVSIGFIYLKKLFKLNYISDINTALIILFVFFGTNLFHYTIAESGMSHAYSFCFVSMFLYFSNQLVKTISTKYFYYSAITFAIILLLRPNNIFILFTIVFWFKNKNELKLFFSNVFKSKAFYWSFGVFMLLFSFQLITWLIKENTLFSNRYAGFGFHWLKPHFFQMLFGFDSGFFIYTPICFIFMLGLIPLYKQNRFAFSAFVIFFFILFYFLSAYSAYTYFDGLGIRVLIDFYPLFALLGAKWLMSINNFQFTVTMLLSVFFTYLSMVYFYQENKSILLRAGMNFKKWQYIFLNTGDKYVNCLGGSNDLTPFAKLTPEVSLNASSELTQPFDFTNKEFGVALVFDSIGFSSNQVQLKIQCSRKELFQNASKDALICSVLEDKHGTTKIYDAFKLNETPSESCCETSDYFYTLTLHGNFKQNDKLTVHLWNKERQPFLISKFSVQVYNYNYQVN